MTLDELKALVESEKTCDVVWVEPQQRIGPDAVRLTIGIPLNRYSSGRFQTLEFILLDATRPVDELTAAFFHELGHKDYSDRTPRSAWNNEETEVFAYTFGLRELMKRGFWDAIRYTIENNEAWLQHNRSESPSHEAILLRVQQTPEWKEAKEALSRLKSAVPNGTVGNVIPSD